MVVQMVVSVGPYRLKKRRPPAQRAATSGEQASPATVIVLNSGSSASGEAASTDGGRVTIEIARSCNNLMKFGPGNSDSCRSRQRVAPCVKAITISKIDASKLYE